MERLAGRSGHCENWTRSPIRALPGKQLRFLGSPGKPFLFLKKGSQTAPLTRENRKGLPRYSDQLEHESTAGRRARTIQSKRPPPGERDSPPASDTSRIELSAKLPLR